MKFKLKIIFNEVKTTDNKLEIKLRNKIWD